MRTHGGLLLSIPAIFAVSCSERTETPSAALPTREATAVAFRPSDVVRQVQLAFRPAGHEGAFEAQLPDARVRFESGRLAWFARADSNRPSFSLETTFVGRARHAEMPSQGARIKLDGQLAIDRGVAVEHLRGIEQGIHQTFQFTGPPPGVGNLVVRVAVHGARHTGKTTTGHHFASESIEFAYGEAVWIDAAGRRTRVPVGVDGDSLLLTVDAATLQGTTWPAELDPIISVRANVNQKVLGYANLSCVEPDVAFDGTNYLVVWSDNRAIAGHLIGVDGARVSPSGTVLDPSGFTIFRSLVNSSIPAVAFDGTNFVVAATDQYGSVRVNRVSPAGQVLDGSSGKQVASTSGYVDVLEVAAGAGKSLVAWTNFTPGSGSIRAHLVDSGGVASGSTLNLSSSGSDHVPAASFNGTTFLVAWRRGSSFGAGSVAGVRIATDGQILDSTPIGIGTAAADRTDVSVASVGTTWLVAWQGASGIVAARVSGSGAVLDATAVALGNSTSTGAPAVAGDGTRFHVAWLAYSGGDTNLLVNRIGTSSGPLDGTGVVVTNASRGTSPSIACAPGGCFSVWSDTRMYATFGLRLQGTTPLDSPPIVVSASASQQDWPSIARAGSRYLVVWDDFRSGTDRQIWAARVGLDGTVLDPAGIDVCSAAADQDLAAVAGNASGDFFVAWADRRAQVTTYVDVYGTIVRGDGTVVTPGGARLTNADDASEPALASDGTGYLLTWYESSAPGVNNVVMASRVGSTGALLDSPPLRFTPNGGGASPTVAFGNGSYLVVFEGSGGLRGFRIPPSGAPLDAVPGLLLASGEFPSATFDGSHWVVGYRRYDPDSSWMNPEYHMYATRVAADGSVLDAQGVRISASRVRGYTSAYYRQGPVAGFDGADSLFTWASNYEGGEVYAAWLSPSGEAFCSSTLVSVPGSIPLTPAIAGRGDGDHSLLVYAYGDPTPGIRNFRVGSQVVTFRVDGHACSTAEECKSGYCVDGVCCDTSCGGGAANDCAACSAAAGATADGVCTPLPAGGTCRASAGACDVADTCDGVHVECRDAMADASTVCRAAQGGCDREEKCTGTSPACPDEAYEPATTTCRAAAGTCDTAEKCTGTSRDCPVDVLVAAGTTCRAAAGDCDRAEVCTGMSARCPDDVFLPASTTCRASAGACDVAEICAGTSAACPADAFQSGIACRPSAGPCDVEETCSGHSALCPVDWMQPAGTSCRPAAGPCDIAEACTGGSAACPSDAMRQTGYSCRPSAGPCDVAEACTGASAACPYDALRQAGFSCRPGTGPCDVAEACTGSSADCPADAFRPASTVCRAVAGPCDAAESCTGSGAACPSDRFVAVGTTCRVQQGPCDVAEACSGIASACPADAFRPPGTVCRMASGVCDAAERCSGSSAACPSDHAQPDGTSCGPATACGGAPVCRAGRCQTGDGLDCDDGDACTIDSCADGTGCKHEPVSGCCRIDADCDDGDACTIDVCSEAACVHAWSEDCSPATARQRTGCGCGSDANGGALFVLLLCLAGLSRSGTRPRSITPARAAPGFLS